jgi:TorA maturation chaperone TorD
MTTLNDEQIEKMSKTELFSAAKARNLKYGKLSLMQIRDLLKQHKELPEVKAKTAKKAVKAKTKSAGKSDRGVRPGTKMAGCVAIYDENPNASRKELLNLFIAKGKLTSLPAASTYLQNIKKLKKK